MADAQTADKGFERDLAVLRAEVRALQERVARLEAAAGSRQVPPVGAAQVPPKGVLPGSRAFSTGGMATLLSQGAVVSLLLLFALVLRTLTDSGTIGIRTGVVTGLVYAALLQGLGWMMYRRAHAFAPILSTGGALLLFSVVLEGRAGFGTISTGLAFAFLALSCTALAVVSLVHRVCVPVTVAVAGGLAAGTFLSFAGGEFPLFVPFLLALNAMAVLAAPLPRCRWLEPAAFAVTAASVSLWGYKLVLSLRGGAAPAAVGMGPGVFFTALAALALFFLGTSAWRVWNSRRYAGPSFLSVLPAAASGWAYLTALVVLGSPGAGRRTLGFAGVVLATALLGGAMALAGRRIEGAPGTATFAFPAAFLLAMSFRDISGQSAAALAALSWAAISLGWLSGRWGSAGVRMTSYGLQGTVMGASLLLLLKDPAGASPIVTIPAMSAVSAIAFVHHRLARRTAPPHASVLFTRLDPADRSASVLLLTSLVGLYLAARATAYLALGGAAASSPDAFRCAQSVLINLGALGLFVGARTLRDAELKWMGVLLTAAGGAKVFTLDLFGAKGAPLLLSVLAFAAAATAGSVVLGRWVGDRAK